MVDKETTSEVSKDSPPIDAGTAPDETKASQLIEVTPDVPTETKAAAPVEEKPKRKPAARAKAPEPDPEPEAEPDPEPEDDYEIQLPTQALQVRIQRALGRHGRYYGPANGRFDDRTLKGIQASLPAYSNDTATGNLDEKDAKAIQRFAKRHGGYAGPVNGDLDANSWTGFALALESTK